MKRKLLIKQARFHVHIHKYLLGIVFVFSMMILLLACSSQDPTTAPPAVTATHLINLSHPSSTPSLTPTKSSTSTRTSSAAQVPSPTSLPLNSVLDVTPSVIPVKTATSIPSATIMPHSTFGIHLSLEMCKETEHFVVQCIDVDKDVSAIIASQLEHDFERITTHLNHQTVEKINVKIYPNLQSFHAAVDHQLGSEWFVGQAESGEIRMVTPLNPGPKHTFDTILSTAVHEFTHLIIDEITDQELPAWLDEGIAGYESGQRQSQFIATQIDSSLPTIAELNFNSGTDSNIIYAFSYTVVEFIVQKFGYDDVVKLVANEGNFEEVLSMSEEEFEQAWQEFIIAEYSQFQEG